MKAYKVFNVMEDGSLDGYVFFSDGERTFHVGETYIWDDEIADEDDTGIDFGFCCHLTLEGLYRFLFSEPYNVEEERMKQEPLHVFEIEIDDLYAFAVEEPMSPEKIERYRWCGYEVEAKKMTILREYEVIPAGGLAQKMIDMCDWLNERRGLFSDWDEDATDPDTLACIARASK